MLRPVPLAAFLAQMPGNFWRSLLSWGPRRFSREAAGPHLSQTGLRYIRGLDGGHAEVGGCYIYLCTSLPVSRPAARVRHAGISRIAADT